MKKNDGLLCLAQQMWEKTIRIMKLTVGLLLMTMITATAVNTYSQNARISLNVKDATILDIFREIERNSEFGFFYKSEEMNLEKRQSIEVSQATIDDILKRVLDENYSYKILDKNIVVTKGIMEGLQQQSRRVVGKVTDSSGGTLPGVSVVVKGTTIGVISDSDGKFSLENIPENAILQFSFVGMKSQEIAILGKATINVKLEEETIGIEEVVAIGYGTIKKSDLTGAVGTLKADAIKSVPTTNVLQTLNGRAAGVQVSQNTGAPGSGISVRIRGTNSIQGSNEPLYVIDGFPSSSNPTVLNNADIESIEILKDASATAIYGSRGANGVMLITTKKGAAGKTQVEFETSYSSQSLIRKLDLMNAKEYALFQNETMVNDKLTPYFTQDQINSFGEGYDWQNLTFQKAPMKTMSLNVSGGNDKTKFSISGSLFAQDGIVKGSDYNRYSLRTNVNHVISKKFTVDLSSTLTRLSSDGKNSGGGNRGSSMIAATISSPATLTPYNADGTYTYMLTAYPFISNSLVNPINYINETTNESIVNMVLTNASIIFKPIPELTVKILGGVENSDSRNDSYVSINFVNSPGSASVSTNQYTSLLSENTISYNKTFNEKHSIVAIAGYTYQDFLSKALSGSGNGFLSDAQKTYELQAAATPGIPNSGYSKSVLESFLARVNYSYNNKYLFTLSGRADGSSKYSEGNKWGYFPSAALAWKISNEDFFRGIDFISALKLRASWGMTGSQAISPYATLSQLYSGKTTFDKSSFTTYAPGARLPGDLKWESTEQKDIGLDLGFLENRINVTADYYIKNTRDLLNTVVLPPTSGFTSTIQNVGEIENKGFEFGLDAIIFNSEFKWNVNATISFNRNSVVKLYDGKDILGGPIDVNIVQDYSNILREGRPLGQFWGYMENGYTSTGQIIIKNLDSDPAITIGDKTYIGNPNPDFIYGLNSVMNFKNFEFTLFFQGSQGNDLLNVSSINNTVDYGIGLNMLKEVYLDHWTPTNLNPKYPIPSRSTKAYMSNRFVEDGSYLRLKNIQLAYSIPVGKLNINWIQNAQIYASGQNLLTLTKYSWWDPEINSLGGSNSVSQGIDYFSYPTAKTITLGIRARF
jgi:TonB-linked SusC/RagA family outer membrane protein